MICETQVPKFESAFKNFRMHQQAENDYNYSNECSQSLGDGASDNRLLILNMRPTLDAPIYYHPSPLPQQYTPQQTFYQANHTPVTISQFACAESLLEHKPTAITQQDSDYRIQTTPLERMCDVCQYPDPILIAPNCNHTFHSRCIHVWPLDACPACAALVDQVAISPTINMMGSVELRSGKWTRHEEEIIDGILCEFDRQALPLAHGTPIRLVLAKMLNCSTMRLSKKFQKNALGKRTCHVKKPNKGERARHFDQLDHAQRQRELSRLEHMFRQELVDQFRRENNTDEGALVETQHLRLAVQQFWVINFLRFAVLIGQPVSGLDVSDAKKRKRAMQLLRNGHFDELMSRHHPSPANMTSVTPMPPRFSATRADNSVTSAPWSANTPLHASSVLGPSVPSIPGLVQQLEQQPVRPMKKMRTPETNVDMGRFDLQPGRLDHPHYAHIGRFSPPPASSTTTFDYSQQREQNSSEPYLNLEKLETRNANAQQHQRQHLIPGLVANESAGHRGLHDQKSEFTPAAFTRVGESYHTGITNQAASWDDLLENMSSEANAGTGAHAAPTNQNHNGHASMQSWSSMHMM